MYISHANETAAQAVQKISVIYLELHPRPEKVHLCDAGSRFGGSEAGATAADA